MAKLLLKSNRLDTVVLSLDAGSHHAPEYRLPHNFANNLGEVARASPRENAQSLSLHYASLHYPEDSLFDKLLAPSSPQQLVRTIGPQLLVRI